MRRLAASFGSWCFVMAVTGTALAQEPFGVDSPTPSPPAAGGTEQAVVGRYWEVGRPRGFAAATVEAGYAYAKPKFTVGYGQPFWRWVGVEAYPLLSLGGVGHYLGVGGAIPGLSARAGGRYTYPFNRSFLAPQDTYLRNDLELLEGPTADHLALEAEVTATVPIAVGSAFLVLTGIRTEMVDEGYYVFEETLRVIAEPPYVWRARLGYLLSLGRRGAIRVGPAADVIGLPGRDAYVVRGGVLGSVLISAHLEAQASFIPVLTSPDSIGLAGGDFGQLGIRFRFATGSTPDPKRVEELKRELSSPASAAPQRR